MTGVPYRNDVPRSPRDEAGQERLVLHEQRPVEAERLAQLRDILGRGAFAEHRLRRIAGHEMDQREDERGDAEQDRES